MKKVFNIYDISGEDGVYIQTVTKEITAKMICRQHNRNGERNYMYLQSYEDYSKQHQRNLRRRGTRNP